MGITIRELAESMKRNDGRREPRPCRCCKKEWTPADWNFYDLCDECFSEFDTQKMRGRFSSLNGQEQIAYFESADEWIQSRG